MQEKQQVQSGIVANVEITNASIAEICRTFNGANSRLLCGENVLADSKRIRLSMKNAPLKEVMDQIARFTNTKAVIGPGAVLFVADSTPKP